MKQFLCILLLISTLFAMDTVTVATEIWAPFRIKKNDIFSGIDIDIIEKIGEEMGIHFEIVQLPWVRCLHKMKNGDVDIMAGLAYTEERAQYITYSDNYYYQCNASFYTLKSDTVEINKYEDLQGLVIGFTRGSAYFEPFNSDTTLHKKDFHGENNLLQLLLNKRINTMIGTDCQVNYDIKQHGYASDIIQQPYTPDDNIKLFFGVSKASPFIKRWGEFNSVLNRLNSEGFIIKSADKYF